MISSASTLLLATLVFNAASVFGAPIRIMDTSSQVARAEINSPAAPVARAAIVDVQDHRRRRSLGHESRRVARLPPQTDEEPELVIPGAVTVVSTPQDSTTQDPPKQQRQRRYPRRVLHDFYEKREPATTIKEKTVVTTKNTTFDSPADLAAFAAANPGAPANSASGVSTVLSVSQTTTIASPDASGSASASTTTASASATATASASGSASASTASASASASASDSGTATASASTSVTTTIASAAGSTDANANANDNKDAAAASGGAEPAITVTSNTGDPASVAAEAINSDERRSTGPEDDEPIARHRRAPSYSGAAWASYARRDAKDNNLPEAGGPKAYYRRETFEPSPDQFVRRSGGAAWASAVRRQVLSSSHSI